MKKKFLKEKNLKEAFVKYVGVGIDQIYADDILVTAFAGSVVDLEL